MLKRNSYQNASPNNPTNQTSMSNFLLLPLRVGKPEIVTEPKDIEISYGQTAVFSCKAIGDPRPEIVWMLNANEIHSDDTRINVLPDGSLRIDEVTANDAGRYECMARNNMGEVHSRQARMIVNNEVIETEAEAPKFIQTPPAELDLLEGLPLVLHCVVSGECFLGD